MNSVTEFMQLCRLCLVKDQVNIPIFEEQGALRHIFLKISACLPVKVSREDDLPKKICDECSYKLETLYQFWNTSVNSEKQLLKWLNQLNLEQMSASHDIDPIHSMNSDGVILKQEIIEETHSTDDLVPDDLNVSNDGQDYLLQQQQLSYQPFSFSQEGFEETEDIESNSGPSSTITSEVAHNVPKLKRRITAIKDLSHLESEGEDEADNMLVAKITKTEEQSDDSAGEDPETTTFVGLPSTSTDNEQPGPSGMGKESSDTPLCSNENSILRRLIIGPSMTVTIQPKPKFFVPKKDEIDKSSFKEEAFYDIDDCKNLLQISRKSLMKQVTFKRKSKKRNPPIKIKLDLKDINKSNIISDSISRTDTLAKKRITTAIEQKHKDWKKEKQSKKEKSQ